MAFVLEGSTDGSHFQNLYQRGGVGDWTPGLPLSAAPADLETAWLRDAPERARVLEIAREAHAALCKDGIDATRAAWRRKREEHEGAATPSAKPQYTAALPLTGARAPSRAKAGRAPARKR